MSSWAYGYLTPPPDAQAQAARLNRPRRHHRDAKNATKKGKNSSTSPTPQSPDDSYAPPASQHRRAAGEAQGEPSIGYQYFATGNRPFLLQYPPCISRMVTPSKILAALHQEAEAANSSANSVSDSSANGLTKAVAKLSSNASTVDDSASGANNGTKTGQLSHESMSEEGSVPPQQFLPVMPLSRTLQPSRCEDNCAGGCPAKDKEVWDDRRLTGSTEASSCRSPPWGAAGAKSTANKGENQLHTAFDPAEIKPWLPGRFELVGKVEDATRNRGTVFVMRDLHTSEGRLVAVKKMPNSWIHGSHKEFCEAYPHETEFPWQDIGCNRFLNSVDFPQACELLGVYRDSEHTGVVTSFCTEGDLFAWCCNLDISPGRDRELLFHPFARQIAYSVQQLHELSIVHRDLSLENMLMTKNESDGSLEVKLIDYGMASTSRYFKNCVRGKASYQAPEVHTTQEYDAFQADAFAVGVIIYSVLFKDYPWLSTRPGGCKCFEYVRKHGFRKYFQKRNLRQTHRPIIEFMSEPLLQLFSGLLALDPEERLTLGESTWGADSGRRSIWDEPWMRGEGFSTPAVARK
eukprot:TRINITY_DN92214_c0_g1_i1.p1 TRINITY_DN92214_c0_g1~~TRINITY_DN92214_c0_g1_i1.p1  ORF type:complete len:575 (+),score=89.89 TRINITY_DN92214_c0_g1_i1:295-2019(+)